MLHQTFITCVEQKADFGWMILGSLARTQAYVWLNELEVKNRLVFFCTITVWARKEMSSVHGRWSDLPFWIVRRCSTSPLWPGAEPGTRMGRYGQKKKKVGGVWKFTLFDSHFTKLLYSCSYIVWCSNKSKSFHETACLMLVELLLTLDEITSIYRQRGQFSLFLAHKIDYICNIHVRSLFHWLSCQQCVNLSTSNTLLFVESYMSKTIHILAASLTLRISLFLLHLLLWPHGVLWWLMGLEMFHC